MVDRGKVENILLRRFSDTTREQVAAAANAIMGLPDEWEEVIHVDQPFGHHFSNNCGRPCYLTECLEEGVEFRLFRRREASGRTARTSRQGSV